MLGQLVAKNARIMVCNHLAEYGRDQIAVIGNGVRSPHWYVVRNTVMILGRIGGEQTVNYLEMAAGHTDSRVRLEAVEALSVVKTDQAVEILCCFLRDSDGGVRLASLNHLEKIGGRIPFESLLRIVTSDDFTDLSSDEQEWFLIAFSRLGGSEVVDILGHIIGRFYIFGGARMVRSRMAALTALAHNRSDDAERVILKFTCSRRRWLREAASAALEQRRQLIYGGGGNDSQ
ncbi:MAG: HEAT repeat domain-containing protein, partial [FCB group bacterium]|nr:HEAT repeat domain-containing protein [FCB group bacterium]